MTGCPPSLHDTTLPAGSNVGPHPPPPWRVAAHCLQFVIGEKKQGDESINAETEGVMGLGELLHWRHTESGRFGHELPSRMVLLGHMVFQAISWKWPELSCLANTLVFFPLFFQHRHEMFVCPSFYPTGWTDLEWASKCKSRTLFHPKFHPIFFNLQNSK